MGTVNPKKFSKTKTDLAGIILCDKKKSVEEKSFALSILSNWRAAHTFPMNVFKNRLDRVAKNLDKNAITAKRLKRATSIIKKLNREYDGSRSKMRLTQMQDIAGVRVVMSNISLVKNLYHDYYLKGDLKHKKVNFKDYITYPKKDGYRSIHLVYRYNSDKGNKLYNGLLVEVQIRSKIQHIWATAVETVGFFIGHTIKSNEGKKEWKDFFKLVSLAFAKIEGCPIIDGTIYDEKELYLLIKKKEKELDVRKKMIAWTNSIKILDFFQNIKKDQHFFLLELDTIQQKLLVSTYSKRQETKAINDYANIEKRIYGKKEYDVVLVGANTTKNLEKAYPNYFVDTKNFIRYLNAILNKY